MADTNVPHAKNDKAMSSKWSVAFWHGTYMRMFRDLKDPLRHCQLVGALSLTAGLLGREGMIYLCTSDQGLAGTKEAS